MKIGQEVECTWGSMKGEKFLITGKTHRGNYTMKSITNGRNYEYGPDQIKAA